MYVSVLSILVQPARLQLHFIENNEKQLMIKARIIDSSQRWETNDTCAAKWQGEPWTLILGESMFLARLWSQGLPKSWGLLFLWKAVRACIRGNKN